MLRGNAQQEQIFKSLEIESKFNRNADNGVLGMIDPTDVTKMKQRPMTGAASSGVKPGSRTRRIRPVRGPQPNVNGYYSNRLSSKDCMSTALKTQTMTKRGFSGIGSGNASKRQLGNHRIRSTVNFNTTHNLEGGSNPMF